MHEASMKRIAAFLAVLVFVMAWGGSSQAYYDGAGGEVMNLNFQPEGQRMLWPDQLYVKGNWDAAWHKMACLNGSACYLTVTVPRVQGNQGPLGVAFTTDPNDSKKWQGEGRFTVDKWDGPFHPTYRVKYGTGNMDGWRVWLMNPSTGAFADVAPASKYEAVPYQTMVTTELDITISTSCANPPALYVGAAFALEQKRPALLQVGAKNALEYSFTTQWGVNAGQARTLDMQLFQQTGTNTYAYYPSNCVVCVYNSKTQGCIGLDTKYQGYHVKLNDAGGRPN